MQAIVNDNNVLLDWIDASTDNSAFRIEYKSSANGSWTRAALTPGDTNTYTLSSLSGGVQVINPGIRYWIGIIANNRFVDFTSSNEVDVLVLSH
jgi:hypothetical protein